MPPACCCPSCTSLRRRLPPHVNDSGFWLVSRCLNLTEAQTLRTWTVLSSVASIVGFAAASLVAALI